MFLIPFGISIQRVVSLQILLPLQFTNPWSKRVCLRCHYTPRNEVRGVYWIHHVCLSVRLSVCLSVRYPFRVRPVASTVQDGFFPYLVQMNNSTRGCVACDDLWHWPISSRSFGHDLENRVRSVASTVLDLFFFLYSTNNCVTIFSESENLNFWQMF